MSRTAAAVGGGVVVIGVALVAILGLGPKKVTLTTGIVCATTDPAQPVIYKKGLLKPKKVKWQVNKDQKNQYHWKITWKGSGTNYLGPVDDIACTGPQHTTSQKAPKQPPGKLQWDYTIDVYDCDGTTLRCSEDPIIWIED